MSLKSISGSLKLSRKNTPVRTQPEKGEGKHPDPPAVLPFEVVVMAGGKGERLSPLTDELPKPLVKIGNRSIVEYSILRLKKAGVRHFTFCVNHLGEKIAQHFGDGADWNLKFDYIFETKPLGTIGGAALKTDYVYNDLLVINGDLLTTLHFDNFFAYYLEQDADMAVATIPYRINLPYGIIEVDDKHVIGGIREKPTFTYHINCGIYFVRRELLELIPPHRRFDAIELIETAMHAGRKVVSFPLLDYWMDIGTMEDYLKAQEDVQFLDL
jgi:NDP-sugar pyrophosphorylase family protein